MAFLILSPFAVAALSAWAIGGRAARGKLLALWPALLTAIFINELRASLTAAPRVVELTWAPSLHLSLGFNLDGLGLLFAILITGIGALIALYASEYLRDHPHIGRFYASLFAFMGAMLGVVLSDNILTLFVFWELTGFTSFLLIGFEHERTDARAAALQALIVTGAGGLALLAAGVLLIALTGTAALTAMVPLHGGIVSSSHYTAIAILILFAAFTKSAQVPFHFWLPNAMAAPTPVSAYLHSATMVKAGIYLIARVTPIVGATELWNTTLMIAGAATMTTGAYRAMQEIDLKRILAYATVSALGVLTMLLGVGTEEAIVAALAYLVAHAGYKGALFLVAGAVDHETGTRDIRVLRGLRAAMPRSGIAAGIAALSMAGVPLTFGFIGKELSYESLLHAPQWSTVLLTLMTAASVLLGVAGLIAGVWPFFGSRAASITAHEARWPMWIPPLILAAASLATGIIPSLLDDTLIAAAAAAAAGSRAPIALALWHGITPALLLSVLTLAGAWLGYAMHQRIRTASWRFGFGTEHIYTYSIRVVDALGRAIAAPLHSASLRSYVRVIVVVVVVLAGIAMLNGPGLINTPRTVPAPHEILIVAVILIGAVSAARARSTMAAVLSLGVVGYAVAIVFLMFGAPDLAMTQFSVETLTVLIYVLVFRHFRSLGARSAPIERVSDATIAGAIGVIIGGLVWVVATADTAPQLREYFAGFGPTLGHGRNIVNVILVDYRGLDTLGEITVVMTAGIAVLALLRRGRRRA